MSNEEGKRLRQHPEERFHPDQLQINLPDVAAKLASERQPEKGKHRQETLYRHGPVTVALFLFDQGASMPMHKAEGVVTVQVLEGRLKMTAEGTIHDLPAGSLLMFAPGVEHDVRAVESTRMLLTVCLERE